MRMENPILELLHDDQLKNVGAPRMSHRLCQRLGFHTNIQNARFVSMNRLSDKRGSLNLGLHQFFDVYVSARRT